MYKKTVTFMDYNDNERTQDFFFHLSDAEILEMELSMTGGLTETIQRIISTQDAPAIVKIFKDLVLKSYGEKDLDGVHFNKSEAISEAFSHTPAYSIIFMELATDADAAAEFVNGIVSANTAKKLKEYKEKNGDNLPTINK